MAEINAGKVYGGQLGDVELFINGSSLGALSVQEDDADSTLSDAISAVSGVSATIDGGELVITSGSAVMIEGSCPCGRERVIKHLHPGTYE